MNVRFVFFSLLFLMAYSHGFGQKQKPLKGLKGSQSVYVEIFGNSKYSVNYDRVFFHQRKNAVGWRAGMNFFPHIKRGYNSYTILGEIYYLRGKAPHFFEAGLGLDYWDGINVPPYITEIHWNLVVRIAGYRYQRPQGGLFFRAGVTPWVYMWKGLDQKVFLEGGVSIGYTFKPSKKTEPAKKGDGVYDY